MACPSPAQLGVAVPGLYPRRPGSCLEVFACSILLTTFSILPSHILAKSHSPSMEVTSSRKPGSRSFLCFHRPLAEPQLQSVKTIPLPLGTSLPPAVHIFTEEFTMLVNGPSLDAVDG